MRNSRGPSKPRRPSQEKLDRLDESFLFERSIDIETYDRHAEKLREELTLAWIAQFLRTEPRFYVELIAGQE